MRRVGCVYRVGCAYIFLRRGFKYATLEVDLDGCQLQSTIAREIAKLVYDKVISRSEAWSRVLLDYPVEGRAVIQKLLGFADGSSKGTGLHIFRKPRVWVLATPTHVTVVAEKHLVEATVGEVAKLLEVHRGGGSGGQAPSQEPR